MTRKKQTVCSKQTIKKPMKLWALAAIDFLVFGICLCTFALFHHVLPQAYQDNISALPTRKPSVTGSGGIPPSSSLAPGTTPSPATPDPNDWGVKFADKFTDGEIIRTETGYRSSYVSVSLSSSYWKSATYYVADIYIRDIECFRTAFAYDKYGKSINEFPLDIALRNNAVCSINGDYYSLDSRGVVIRNGTLYRDDPNDDVCVLYYDGTMKTYSEQEFDAQTAMNNGAFQAWTFGPALLDNGQALSDFDSSVSGVHPRTAVGYYEPGHYCFVVVDGRQAGYSSGMNLNNLALLLENLGCQEAYNLDGGQSSVMTFGSSIANRPYKGGRDTSDILFIYDFTE